MDGYRFSLQGNDSYAFRSYPRLTEYQRIHQEILPDLSGQSRVGVARCEKCGELTNKWAETLTSLLITVRDYDISITYDGVVVVSNAFKRVCDKANLVGLSFRVLPSDPDFYDIRPSRVVYFDSERRKTRFTKQCNLCGHWESVTGATPVLLRPGSVIGDREFVRTDLEFASLDEKSPLILCGPEAAKALRESELNGVNLCELITERERRALESQQRN